MDMAQLFTKQLSYSVLPHTLYKLMSQLLNKGDIIVKSVCL